jgi:hypothetical protein
LPAWGYAEMAGHDCGSPETAASFLQKCGADNSRLTFRNTLLKKTLYFFFTF